MRTRAVAALAAAILATAALIVWVAGGGSRLGPAWRSRGSAPADVKAVDAWIAEVSRPWGEPAARATADGVVRARWELPPPLDPAAVAAALRRDAEARGIELYASVTPESDARIRVYAGAALRWDLLLVPPLPEHPPRLRPASSRQRPYLALVVAGLGTGPAPAALDRDLPLTVAVVPGAPYALRVARAAALRWQEVLVDLRAAASPLIAEPAAALAAVPHATGILTDGPPSGRFAGAGLLVHPRGASLSRRPPGLDLLASVFAGEAGAGRGLARACALARRRGSAALVLGADDPELAEVMAWAGRAEDDGYRLVLASEAARADEVRGLPYRPPRR